MTAQAQEPAGADPARPIETPEALAARYRDGRPGVA